MFLADHSALHHGIVLQCYERLFIPCACGCCPIPPPPPPRVKPYQLESNTLDQMTQSSSKVGRCWLGMYSTTHSHLSYFEPTLVTGRYYLPVIQVGSKCVIIVWKVKLKLASGITVNSHHTHSQVTTPTVTTPIRSIPFTAGTGTKYTH